jgi:hypothetical protein
MSSKEFDFDDFGGEEDKNQSSFDDDIFENDLNEIFGDDDLSDDDFLEDFLNENYKEGQTEYALLDDYLDELDFEYYSSK